MSKKTEQRDKLLETAKLSKNPTVKAALEKLLFAVSLAHDKEYITWANGSYYQAGCTITIPAMEHATTFQLHWGDKRMQIFSTEYQVMEFEYGHLYNQTDPIPGVYLIKESQFP